jgi:hypothetical protein
MLDGFDRHCQQRSLLESLLDAQWLSAVWLAGWLAVFSMTYVLLNTSFARAARQWQGRGRRPTIPWLPHWRSSHDLTRHRMGDLTSFNLDT